MWFLVQLAFLIQCFAHIVTLCGLTTNVCCSCVHAPVQQGTCNNSAPVAAGVPVIVKSNRILLNIVQSGNLAALSCVLRHGSFLLMNVWCCCHAVLSLQWRLLPQPRGSWGRSLATHRSPFVLMSHSHVNGLIGLMGPNTWEAWGVVAFRAPLSLVYLYLLLLLLHSDEEVVIGELRSGVASPVCVP